MGRERPTSTRVGTVARSRLNPENRVEPIEILILGAVSLFGGCAEASAGYLSQVQHHSDSRIVRYLLGWTLYYHGQPAHAEAMLETMIGDEGPLPRTLARRSLPSAPRAERPLTLARSPSAWQPSAISSRALTHSPRRM